jgi:2-polyprenyl-6-hydroxyphenyl methylase/3-demethylubiquinone-9 3-methyltransferase
LPPVQVASILDHDFISQQLQHRQFDIVHSWGALHHTGNMTQAIDNAARLVKKTGYLIISIYNQHWSSPLWHCIKWMYSISPSFARKALIGGLYPIIYTAKFLVTGKNPKRKERGMDFFYDVVDWVGGYPYEYASISRIKELVCSKNFVCVRVIPAQVPTGCNQFVFKRYALR